MRFVFIEVSPANIPGMRITKDQNDNLATINDGPTVANTYFTCGDLVLNYNQESGEVVSFDGYLPYFETLQVDHKAMLPAKAIPARLFVGDLSDKPIFSVEKLPLQLLGGGNIIHAGRGKSSQILKLSEDIYIGLNNESITDMYLRLS